MLLDDKTEAFHEASVIPPRCAPVLWIAKASAIRAITIQERASGGPIPPPQLQERVNLVTKGSMIMCTPALIVRNIRNLTSTISGGEPELPNMDLDDSGITFGEAKLSFRKLRYAHSGYPSPF